MTSLKKMYIFLKKLNLLLEKKDKKFLYLLILFSICISVIETLGVSIIMPYLTMINDPEIIKENKYIYEIFLFLNFKTYSSFMIFLGFVLIVFYVFRSIMNISYIYSMARFSNGLYHTFATNLFACYLKLPYNKYVMKNSSYLTKNIINEVSNLSGVFNSLLLICSEILVVLFIYILFLIIDVNLTLMITCILIMNVFFILKLVSKKIKEKGIERANVQAKLYESLNSSFGNYKMLKINNIINTIIGNFFKDTYFYSRIGIVTSTLKNSPKLIFEAIAFSLILCIVIYFIYIYEDDAASKLGILSAFVLGLYRLMPSVNRIVNAYNDILYQLKAFEIVYEDFNLEIEKLGDKKIPFTSSINIDNISFYYGTNRVLNNINLVIKKGDKIAFKGLSGGGKSTLIDIIMGLLEPSEGKIYIDKEELNKQNLINWRNHIGYIPQQVYLFDGTVKENVVFEREYNELRLIESLKKAKIYDYLILNEGLDTKVGEAGIKMSGGQKQRIAIARAIYTNPDVLILDEATSALDEATEEEIMDEIYNICENKTLIIIAHRLSTIKGCNKIYELKNGNLVNE